MDDSEKTSEYIRAGGGQIVPPNADAIRLAIAQPEPQNTRDFILTNYSEHTYAHALESGLQALI